MITMDLRNIKEVHDFEIVVDGQRCITISVNEKNLSVQIPGGVNPKSISDTEGSFFLRTKDRDSHE